VTLGLLGYVLTRIEWQDSVRYGKGPDVKVVWGSLQVVDGKRVLVSHGITHEIADDPVAEANDPEKGRFAPGFIRLVLSVHKKLLLLAVLLLPVSFLILAIRWRWLLGTHGLDPGIGEAIRLTWVGLVANNILPSSIGGDAVKAYCISRRAPHKRVAAVMTVLMDRVLGLVALLMVGGIALCFQATRPELTIYRQTLLIGLLGLIVGLFLFFSGRVRTFLRIQELIVRLPLGKHLKQLDDSVFHYRHHPKVMLASIAISLVLHGWTIGCIALMGRALGMHADLIHYYTFLPLIFTMGAFIPSIGGLGVLEGAFAFFFSMGFVGERASNAVALCLLYRMVQILLTLPGIVWFQRELSAVKAATQTSHSEVNQPGENLLTPQGINEATTSHTEWASVSTTR
jgi:hypothetical protein